MRFQILVFDLKSFDLSLFYADDGMVTAAEFEEVWLNIAVGFGLPAEDHTRYFAMVGNSSITLIRFWTAVPKRSGSGATHVRYTFSF